MGRNRLIVVIGSLGVGLAAGYVVFLNDNSGQQTIPEKIIERVTIDSVDVLVASTEIPPAGMLSQSNLVWQQWPTNAANGLVMRSQRPNAPSELDGALARVTILAGEPLRQTNILEKGSRFMSVMLAPGKRAIAIPLDQAGGTTAGGFVLPNDYVDVVRVENSGQRPGVVGQIILSNVRVLAIGPNVGEKAGEKVVLGQTATLELDPEESEFLISAMQGASLFLALRSMAESGTKKTEVVSTPPSPARTIIRAGVPSAF